MYDNLSKIIILYITEQKIIAEQFWFKSIIKSQGNMYVTYAMGNTI